MEAYSARKAESFVGLARIDLDQISFGDALNLNENHRSKSEKSVARMLGIFKLEGCIRGEDRNFIEGLIGENDLDTALANAGVTRELLKLRSHLPLRHVDDVVKLRLDEPMQCNDGLHRVLAAKQFLDNNDRWWIVKLYRKEEYPNHARLRVYESYAHEQSYTDGTIFRNIRMYHQAGNQSEERKWWARLTDGKKKDLRQLILSDKYNGVSCESHQDASDSIIRVFDEMLDIAGLWPPIQLGTLHRLHGLRCREELLSYLLYVKQTWASIVPRHCWKNVDEITVSKLELLAPAISSRDHEYAKRLMQDHMIFVTIKDTEIRAEILQNILSQKRLIPSLRTFFEDQKYLEPCSNILKSLLDDDERRPLWRAFKANYWPTSSVQVQFSEGVSCLGSIEYSSVNEKDLGMKTGYVQLWLFCMRHFPELTTIKPRIESRRKKKILREYNSARLQQLGALAVKLGFKTPKALALAFQLADWTEDLSRRMMQPTSSLAHTLPFSSDQYWSRDRRSGRPYDEDHDNDQSSLFLFMFYYKAKPGHDITPLYGKRNMLEAFLGPFIPAIQHKMENLLDLLLSQPSTAQVVDTVQQEGLRTRNDELDRLRKELVARQKKIEDCEAMSIQQFSLFESQIASKTSKVDNLERQLAECQKNNAAIPEESDIHETQYTRELKAASEKLRAKVSAQEEHIARLLSEKEAIVQENSLLQHQLSASEEENEVLLAQIDSSDVLGAEHENSNLGALPCEDNAFQNLRQTVDLKEAHIKTLEESLEAKIIIIENLQARAKQADITISALETTAVAVRKNRHIILEYDILSKVKHVRELDVEKILYLGAQEQWHSDIATILRSVPVSPQFIHVTILHVDADAGIRSVMAKVPIDKEFTIVALLDCLRKLDRNHGLYLTWSDTTKSSLMSRVLTHQPNDAAGFLEVCQQPDARVFFGHYEHFQRFFEKYKSAYLRDQVLSSNKRVGDLLEATEKRAAPSSTANAEGHTPNTPRNDHDV